jgi:hypothetical protein
MRATMILTREHALAFGYWRTPARLRGLLQPPSIDQLVNDHASIKPGRDNSNALHLAILRRRNGDSAAQAIEPSSWDMNNNRGRYYAFKRWSRRLNQGRNA